MIEKILKHLGLWDLKVRPPPKVKAPSVTISIDDSDSQIPFSALPSIRTPITRWIPTGFQSTWVTPMVRFCLACILKKNLRFEDQIETFPSFQEVVLARYSLLKLGQNPSCDGLDLASQAWCRAGARADEEDSPISCGRFFLTYYFLFCIFNPSRSKFLSLHYVLDLWFERVVKPRMGGKIYLIRYLDDFVVCFQFRADVVRFREVLKKRLQKFSHRLEPTKTKLVEFGRFATRHAKERGKRMETISFLGFTHFCTISQKGNFMVGRKTEKSRQRRCIGNLSKIMQIDRHKPLGEQAKGINQILQGYYAYYGMGGNIMSLHRIYRFTERY